MERVVSCVNLDGDAWDRKLCPGKKLEPNCERTKLHTREATPWILLLWLWCTETSRISLRGVTTHVEWGGQVLFIPIAHDIQLLAIPHMIYCTWVAPQTKFNVCRNLSFMVCQITKLKSSPNFLLYGNSLQVDLWYHRPLVNCRQTMESVKSCTTQWY